MQEKLKELELLISRLAVRQKETQAQNAALKQRIYVLEESIGKLKAAEAEMRALKEWKKNTQVVLKRLLAKVEKELAKAHAGKME